MRPPFGLGHEARYERVRLAPLLAEIARVFERRRDRVEFVALGGDRGAINAVLEAKPELGWLSVRRD